MADRIIQSDTLQGIANALRGGSSQSAADKIEVADFAEVAEYLKVINDSCVGYFNRSATSITIPEGVTSIFDNAFYRYAILTNVNLPSTLISIGNTVFRETGLTSITIPVGVTSIGDNAFYSCTSLASITIPEGVTSIGSQIFRGCTSLASITLPESIRSIGANAFYGIAANAVINCGFSEGAVSGAPWGAPETVTINYDVTPQA